MNQEVNLAVLFIQPIDPLNNPAQDNWLSREIARQVFYGQEELYYLLTQSDFDSIISTY